MLAKNFVFFFHAEIFLLEYFQPEEYVVQQQQWHWLTWHDWQFYFLCFETNDFLNIWLSDSDYLSDNALLLGAVSALWFFLIFLQSETETDLSSRNIINPPAEAWIVHLICRPQPVSAVLCSVMRYIASLKLRGKRGIKTLIKLAIYYPDSFPSVPFYKYFCLIFVEDLTI